MHSIRESLCLWHVFVFVATVDAVESAACNYTAGDIVGIVVGSVIITLVVVALSLLFLWYLWKNNHLKLALILRTQKKGKVESTVNVVRSDVEAGHEFAFDNPYFKDDDNEVINGNLRHCNNTKKPQNEVNKGDGRLTESRKQQSSDHFAKECDNKRNDLEKVCEDKKRLIKSLPLANVFNHVSRSKQNQKFAAVDDTYINSKPQQVVVQLTGHDFTGLGFNICGNMRDGIFVKDVMSRGPANESGKVKAGDKIVSITIACRNMVYEDALTILSYASPYNVELLLEKGNNKENACLNLGQTRKTYLSNNSILGSGRRLLHPLYRSQSLEDLTQIGHSMSEKSFASGSNSPQNVLQKLKSQLINRSAKSDSSEKDRTCFSSDPKVAGNSVTINESTSPAKISQSETSKVTATCTPPFAGYSPLKSSESKQTTENVNIEKDIDVTEVTLELNADKLSEENEHVSQCPPLPAPRRPVSAGKKKGKAPQPPSVTNLVTLENLSPVRQDADDVPDGQVCKATVETRAQVHQEDEITSCSIIESSGDYVSNKDSETKSTTKESSQEEKLLNGHAEESEVKTNTQHSPSKVQNNEKPKSSSLGDLTLAHKANANVLQSVILERAVSLDLKGQHFPEENLCHHFKNIRVPSDVDYKNSENIAFSKWQMKKAETSSIFTTSSSDCMGSNAIISMNGRLGNFECDDSLICIDVSKDNFTASTPLKKDQYLVENLIDNDSMNEKCSDALSEGKIDDICDTNETLRLEFEDTGKENEITLTEDVCHKQIEKDVIQIDKNELDNVMMSYQQYTSFLERQIQKAKRVNAVPPVNSVPVNNNCGVVDMSSNQLDFESWSYISDHDNSISQDSSHYRTAIDEENFLTEKHMPEISGVTLKSS